MKQEKNLIPRKKSQHIEVTPQRCLRLMNLMHKESKKSGITFSKGLSKEILRLIKDAEYFSNEPPPIPVNVQSLREELEIEKQKVAQLAVAVDEIGDIALNYKAEAMAERVENKRFVDSLSEWLPKKVSEALKITEERVGEGRELRVKQCLHALKKPQKLSAN